MKELNQQQKFYTALVVVLLATVIVTAQSILLGPKLFGAAEIYYTHFNNYIIFKQSFFHLIENTNLYNLYLTEQWDLYKYSPTFSLFMGSLAYLPDWLGLFIWNLLNASVLFFALWNCRLITGNNKYWVILFVLIELITSMQNAQSNGLIAGLIVMAFNLLEKDRVFWAVLLISLSVYIKIFGLVAFLLVLLYPSRWRGVLYSIFWMLVLAVLPMLVIPYNDIALQYQNWLVMLQQDHDISLGISFAGFVNAILPWDVSKLLILAIGTFFLFIPLVRYKYFSEIRFRILYLAAILIWEVIFNHKAESPTFIIAMSGAGIWFFTVPKLRNLWMLGLMVFAFVFTSLSSTDIFPALIKQNFIEPYAIKSLPCILIWIIVVYQQLRHGQTEFDEI